MKCKFLKTGIACAALASLMALPAQASELSEWAVTDYSAAGAYGLLTPNITEEDLKGNITREEFCELAMNIYTYITNEELPEAAVSPFTDTDNAYVSAAYMYGIVSGVTDTEFMPQKTITRQELATMLLRTLQSAGTDVRAEEGADLSEFSDGDEVSYWAVPAVAALSEAGVITGMDGGFNPLGGATREQAVVMTARACEVYGDGAVTYAVPEVTADASGLEWTPVSEADAYYVTVNSSGNAVKSELLSNEVTEYEPEYDYCTVSVAAVYGDTTAFALPETIGSAPETAVGSFFEGPALTLEEKEYRIFGSNGYYNDKETAQANMTTVTVDVWKLKADGTKYASTAEIEVNKALAEDVKAIFTEIFNDSSQFPIKTVGGFSWRGVAASGSRSQHSYGTCIDINYNENYYIRNGTVYSGSYWKPYEDPYSITPDGIVVQTFAKYGWDWGGTAWSSSKDYMHFTYLGK